MEEQHGLVVASPHEDVAGCEAEVVDLLLVQPLCGIEQSVDGVAYESLLRHDGGRVLDEVLEGAEAAFADAHSGNACRVPDEMERHFVRAVGSLALLSLTL